MVVEENLVRMREVENILRPKTFIVLEVGNGQHPWEISQCRFVT